MFILSGNDDSSILKSYKATTTGTKSVVTIQVEVSDHWDLSHMLRQLEDILSVQKVRAAARKAEAARKPAKAAPKPLALPPPVRRLPAPGDL